MFFCRMSMPYMVIEPAHHPHLSRWIIWTATSFQGYYIPSLLELESSFCPGDIHAAKIAFAPAALAFVKYQRRPACTITARSCCMIKSDESDIPAAISASSSHRGRLGIGRHFCSAHKRIVHGPGAAASTTPCWQRY